MSYTNPRSPINQYAQVNAKSGVESASPHRLIQLLFDGALEKIAKAKGCMLRGEIACKGEQISKAISIVQGLQSSLDFEVGGELAKNLDDLYEHMQGQLLAANVNNESEKLDEVSDLLATIKNGWDGISDQPDAGQNAPKQNQDEQHGDEGANKPSFDESA